LKFFLVCPEDFVILGFTTKNIFSMALLRMITTSNPITGASVVGGSALYIYNRDQINWQTLASKTGSGGSASSLFNYQLQNGGTGVAAVKHSVTNIMAAASPAVVA
jgi:hypothetical protein